LASSLGLPQKGLACTMLIRLDFNSKFMSHTTTLGPVATLVAEGTEKSWRVFSAVGSGADGAWMTGSTTERMNWGGSDPSHEKLVIHYLVFIQQEKTKAILSCISNSYFLNILRRVCISKLF
jgi:hypothetical protein